MRRGAAKIGWEKENCEGGGRTGGDARNEIGAKRENRAFSVFWLERNPMGREEKGVKGRRRGADTFEQSRKLSQQRGQRRREGSRRKRK